MPYGRRDDVPVKEVAERWLDGATILDLSNEYDSSQPLIRRRIAQARELYPRLPWHKRDTGPGLSAAGYARMTDGKKGAATPGSRSVGWERRLR